MTNQPELNPCVGAVEALADAMADDWVENNGNYSIIGVIECLNKLGYTITRAEPVAPSSDEVEEAFSYITPHPENHSFISFSSNKLRGCVNTLRAHIYNLEAQVKQQQWQPIETAPKDGTYILATTVGNHPISKEPWIGDVCYWDGRSFDNDSDSLDERDWWKPTLWMPMPPPPHKDTCVVCGHLHVGLACPTLSVISTCE